MFLWFLDLMKTCYNLSIYYSKIFLLAGPQVEILMCCDVLREIFFFRKIFMGNFANKLSQFTLSRDNFENQAHSHGVNSNLKFFVPPIITLIKYNK